MTGISGRRPLRLDSRFGLLCWISGFLFGSLGHRKLWCASFLINGLALSIILVMRWWAYRQLDALAKQRDDFLRGASGEISVGYKLADFPQGYYIVNDLKTESGNLDHIVIGPTGVFALDTKSWRGIVSADGKGDLLVNGQWQV